MQASRISEHNMHRKAHQCLLRIAYHWNLDTDNAVDQLTTRYQIRISNPSFLSNNTRGIENKMPL